MSNKKWKTKYLKNKFREMCMTDGEVSVMIYNKKLYTKNQELEHAKHELQLDLGFK